MDLIQCVRTRGYKRTQITKLYDKVYSEIGNFSVHDKITHLKKAHQLNSDIQSLDSEVSSLKWALNKDEEQLESDLEENEAYRDRLIETITLLETDPVDGGDNNVPVASPDPGRNRLKLPEVPLPYFSNSNGETLDFFLNAFDNTVDKFSLSSYEKYILLKRQLKGEPLILIDSLDISRQSYDEAIGLLKQAFGNETLNKFDALRRLSEIKLTYKSNPYEFVGEMRIIQSLFENLKIEVKDVLHYFLWQAMTPNLQNQLVNICNDNKPNLDKINANIFKALDRYIEVGEQIKGRQYVKNNTVSEATSFAAAVTSYKDSRKKFCSLCTDKDKCFDHNTKDCPEFKSAESKVSRIESLGGCKKCGYSNHSVANCKFKFSRKCYYCNADHMSYLCVGKTKNSKPSYLSENGRQGAAGSSKVNTSSSWTSVLNNDIGCDSILPTFTCNVKGAKIRGMKDSGSQSHFIRKDVAMKLKLPIVENNCSITVNGINEAQRYETNVVEVPIEINYKVYNVKAICIPEIRTNLKLPNLSVCVDIFESKGYRLADSDLSNCSDNITNLDFILGTNDPHVLLERQVPFGKDKLSVFSNTDAGVMLMGNIDLILTNASDLPESNIKTCNSFVSSMLSESKDVPVDKSQSISSAHSVIKSDGEIDNFKLDRAIDEMLNISLNYDKNYVNEESTEINDRDVNYAFNNCTRMSDGRLVMPLLWKPDVKHLLGNNFDLARKILMTNVKRYEPDGKLIMIDEVFKQQLRDGIIEPIEDLDEFRANTPDCSFLPHMGVFRPEKQTTKCRVVFLSNLCEKTPGKEVMSHNQVINSGPCLNQKITTAVNQLRFGEYMLTYDLKKAFLSIGLNEDDSNKLLFLWFRNISEGDYSLVAYRNVRLSFGLRASPTILMLALYKILCIDIENDSDKLKDSKKLLYTLFYMDNGAFNGSAEDVKWMFNKLNSIFNPYKFDIQQITSNELSIQNEVDKSNEEITPDQVPLLGIRWNRISDKLSAKPIELNPNANTKRLILRSIASQFDLNNYQGPLLNRARIFMHKLQCTQSLDWDKKLDKDLIKEWKNIVAQANKSLPVEISRCVGERSDDYELVAFTDASKSIYAAVVYINNLTTGNMSFLCGKNRMVNRQLETKSIPTLELQAIALGVEVLIDIKDQLSGSLCLNPINIKSMKLFSDSMISLHWLNSFCHRQDKMSKQSVFVINRLTQINRLCKVNPVSFRFVDTNSNPADCLTRSLSYKCLMKTSYCSGPSDILSSDNVPILQVDLPSPLIAQTDADVTQFQASVQSKSDTLIEYERYSRLSKIVRIHANVLKFVNLLKVSAQKKSKLVHLKVFPVDQNYFELSSSMIIRDSQRYSFPDVYNYLEHPNCAKKDIPNICNKLNIFIDNGLLKIKCKMQKFDGSKFTYPLLLDRDHLITKLLIRETHENMAHSGCYAVLNQLRKHYWIDKIFSTTKKVIKECVTCRRMNARIVKLNQNDYREFRSEPTSDPYKYIFMDHLGPFHVKHNGTRKKVWLLILTCLWSRSVNLKLCDDLSVKSFLRAFQMHIFDHGLPVKVFSDLGSQLTSGAKTMEDILNNEQMRKFLHENGIKSIDFSHYFKGNSSLGSLVEICVKFCKKLIYGAIKTNVLERSDFELVISQTIYLVNKRPISFKDSLRENDNVELPEVITPELLVTGRNKSVLNILPLSSAIEDGDEDWLLKVDRGELLKQQFAKVNKVMKSLGETYEYEFINRLIDQSTDKPGRYRPVSHEKIDIGDIVLLKDPFLKVFNYPMGIVQKVYVNSIDEVTDIEVLKGKTGEVVKRHVSSVIPLFRPNNYSDRNEVDKSKDLNCRRSKRLMEKFSKGQN